MSLKSIEELRRLIESLRGKTIVLTTHKNADPDALASILVLYHILKQQKNTVYVVVPEGFNEVSKRIIEEVKPCIEVMDPLILMQGLYSLVDYVVIVDTSSSVQLGMLSSILSKIETIVIDHHRYGDLRYKASYSYIDPEFRSNSELVFQLVDEHYLLERIHYTLLLAGILYDTRRFIHITPRTFTIVSKILLRGGDYHYALKLLQKKMDYSERIARLKAAQRMIFRNCKGYIVAVSHVGAFEASAANAIIELGADLAVIYSIRKKLVRVTIRSSRRFYEETGISLARDLAPLIAEMIKGVGGGHDTAASIEGSVLPSSFHEKVFSTVCGLIEKV